MTLREALYKILQDDAKLSAAGTLGALLGQSSSAPYGVYFMQPPDKPILPCLTYFFNAQAQRFPRLIPVNITVWGNTNLDVIQQRINALLDENTTGFSSITDFTVLSCKWNWAAPDRWQETLKCYLQQHRFVIQGIKS